MISSKNNGGKMISRVKTILSKLYIHWYWTSSQMFAYLAKCMVKCPIKSKNDGGKDDFELTQTNYNLPL